MEEEGNKQVSKGEGKGNEGEGGLGVKDAHV